MILVHLTTLYPGYLADFERRHPEVAKLTYEEHRTLLYRDAFAWSDHFTRHLAARGHRTEQFIVNYPALQGKWAAEHYIEQKPNAVIDAGVLAAQLRAACPEILFVDDCYAFPPESLRAIRKANSSIRGIVCHHGLDGDPRTLFPPDALVVTPAAHQVSAWRDLGFDAVLLRHAFEPAVLADLPATNHRTVMSFLGSCSPLLHPERHAWLAAIARAVPSLEVWTDSFISVRPRLLIGSLRRGRAGRVYQHFTSPLRARAHPPLFGRALFTQLRDSEVTLNCHITLARRSAGNMRLFEATGAGACLITDDRDDLSEIFEPGSEVVTYQSNQECIEKAQWLLDHPTQAREIALRGQKRTLRDHTFARRAMQLEALLLDHLQHSRPAT